MSLTTTCCNCGTRQPLAAGFADDDGKRFGVAMGELPPQLARAAVAYLAVFKPAKTELRTSRATKIVNELAALVSAGSVTRDERSGIRRPASVLTWVAGIEQLLAAPPSGLPLGNHNYLRAIVYELADKADAGAERQREATMRAGKHRAGPSTPVPREHPLQAALAHLRTLLDYGQINQAEYDQRAADERAKHREANDAD
jgi:hypothetical protein